MRAGDRVIRWTTTLSVVVLAGIAAVLSYKHMYVLVRRYGEVSWTSMLLPVSVDGMIVASSMTLLADSRNGRRSGLLPWILLVIGSTASLAANVAVAEPSAVGRLIAAWQSCALIGSYELLMRQVRNAAGRVLRATPAPHTEPDDVTSYVPHTVLADGYEASDDAHTADVGEFVWNADDAYFSEVGESRPGRGRSRRGTSELQRRAWSWAVANRTSAGDLPSGKAIAEVFGRGERWGRLVKQAGTSGRLDPA